MVSADTLPGYADWKLPFIFHTDTSDKQVGSVISHKNIYIAFFSRILIKPTA